VDIDSACLCESARRTARRLTAIYDENLKSTGLNIGQFSILNRLRKAEPLSISQLAEALELEQSTMTRNIATLKKMRAIAVATDKNDARIKGVKLTQKGRELFALATPLWHKSQKHAKKLMMT
jgi:DNA-binding MarR family transcriptional regulator